MKNVKPYHVLFIRKNGVWNNKYGNYDKDTVLEELQWTYSLIPKRNKRIVTFDSYDNSAINSYLKAINE